METGLAGTAPKFETPVQKSGNISYVWIGLLFGIMLCILGVMAWYIFDQWVIGPLNVLNVPSVGQRGKLSMADSEWMYLASDKQALNHLLNSTKTHDEALIQSLVRNKRLFVVPARLTVEVIDSDTLRDASPAVAVRRVRVIEKGGYRDLTGWVLGSCLERLPLPKPAAKPKSGST